MSRAASDWGTHQLSEFLASVTAFQDEPSALLGATERAAEALEAEIAVTVRGSQILALVGLSNDDPRVAAVLEANEAGERSVTLDGLGVCSLVSSDLEDGTGSYLVLARTGPSRFDGQEVVLVSNMGRTLGLVMRMLRTLEAERLAASRLRERQQLLERLSKIQRSISRRAPLQEVLDTITEGIRELTGDEISGLRLFDPDDPGFLVLASASGVRGGILEQIRRSPVGEGAGGRAAAEGRLVIIDNCSSAPGTVGEFAEDGMQSAMAAPVYQDGAIAGSLVSASYKPGRTYSEDEQEILLAIAEFASIALTDAKTVEEMNEARQAKEMFLAMVSHELKTPLTVMMGALRTVEARTDSLSASVRDELLRAALSRGRDLQRLIEMLLKGARAELAGARRHIQLGDLVASSIKGFEAVRPIQSTMHPAVPLLVDDDAVVQILGVFIENAIAHSPEGSTITVESLVEPPGASITIRNEGSLPDDLDPEELFKPFQRGADATSSGVGLGLYIARQLAESLGGTVDVERGTEDVAFILWFPTGVKESADRLSDLVTQVH